VSLIASERDNAIVLSEALKIKRAMSHNAVWHYHTMFERVTKKNGAYRRKINEESTKDLVISRFISGAR